MRKKIIIDVATIYPGRGGAGGGIWNYAKNLIVNLDVALAGNDDLKLICLVNKQFNLPLKNIQVKVVPFNPTNFLFRFFYIHVYLPVFVLTHKGVLHKVYFEVPFWTPFKTIVTIHDLMGRFYINNGYKTSSFSERIKSFYFDLVNTKAVTKSDSICTPSHFVKQELIDLYHISPEKVTVTPLAATNFDGFLQKPELFKNEIGIYCIAAFHPHKGHLRLVEIFETLCEDFKADVKLYLRGHIHDHCFFETLSKKIAASTARDKIQILNYQNSSSLEDIYQEADWVILLSEYEGFGLPVIEAQASGTPVICSSIPTFREVGGDSVFYLSDELDKKTAGQLLWNLISNSKQRNFYIHKGFENVKKYSWTKLADQMLTVYRT